jgi:hypothetical protein
VIAFEDESAAFFLDVMHGFVAATENRFPGGAVEEFVLAGLWRRSDHALQGAGMAIRCAKPSAFPFAFYALRGGRMLPGLPKRRPAGGQDDEQNSSKGEAEET